MIKVINSGNQYSDNVLDSVLGFNNSETWSVSSGTGTVVTSDDYSFEGDKSLKIASTDLTADFIVTNVTQNTIIGNDADYGFALYVKKTVALEVIELKVNIFKGGVLEDSPTLTIGNKLDSSLDDTGVWVRYMSDTTYTFAKDEVITFTFTILNTGVAGSSTIYADGMMLYKMDRLDTLPPYYTKTIEETTLEGMTTDFYLEVKKGNVPNHSHLDVYGKNPDIDTGNEDIWNGGGDYTGFPTGSAETLEARSSNPDDTIAGTGARTLRIYNLIDDTGASLPDVDIEMDGTDWVSLGAQTYYRGGSKSKVLTAGSGGKNAGEITIRHTTTTANIFAVMPSGNNDTAISAYTVPLGKTLYMKASVDMSRLNGSPGSAITTLRARPHGGVFNTVVNPTITDSKGFKSEEAEWYEFPERTDLKWRVESVSDANTTATSKMWGILKDN